MPSPDKKNPPGLGADSNREAIGINPAPAQYGGTTGSNESLPSPLVSNEVDLRDFPFMPLMIGRLFSSDFNAKASDAEWRAAVTLWARAWHQLPAASLPTDDTILAYLAGYGRDTAAWFHVKPMALHGFIECHDNRYYHTLIAVLALEAWSKKQAYRARTRNATEARRKHYKQRNDELAEPCNERDVRQGTVEGTGTGNTELSLHDSSAGELPSGVFLEVPLNDGTTYKITNNAVERWQGLYRGIDVKHHLVKLVGWNVSSPKRRKTRQGIEAHVTHWLAKEHDKGAGNGQATAKRSSPNFTQGGAPVNYHEGAEGFQVVGGNGADS